VLCSMYLVKIPVKNYYIILHVNRSQWPRGLRHGSAAARLLGLWVRIPRGMHLCVLRVVCCQVEFSASG
jgi:hypothetical protein